MDTLQIFLLAIGIISIFASSGITRAVSRRQKALALPKVNITLLDIIYAITMIIGILAKEVWDNINETGTATVKLPRLIAALIVSPIIYAAIYSKIVKEELSLLNLALAFQNGFFWQAVFRTSQGSN